MVRMMLFPFPTSTCLTDPFSLIPAPVGRCVEGRGVGGLGDPVGGLFVGLPEVSHSAEAKHLPRTLHIIWLTGQEGGTFTDVAAGSLKTPQLFLHVHKQHVQSKAEEQARFGLLLQRAAARGYGGAPLLPLLSMTLY